MKFEIGFVFFIDLLVDYDKSIAIKDKVLDELDKIDEIESVDVINDGEDWNIECLAIIDAPNGEEVKDIFEKKISSAEKVYLDEIHKAKIAEADLVFIVNQNGYIGESTRSEIDWARELDKKIEYLEPQI